MKIKVKGTYEVVVPVDTNSSLFKTFRKQNSKRFQDSEVIIAFAQEVASDSLPDDDGIITKSFDWELQNELC